MPTNWPGDSADLITVVYERFCGRQKASAQTETFQGQSLKLDTISWGKLDRPYRFSASKHVTFLLRRREKPSSRAHHDDLSLPELSKMDSGEFVDGIFCAFFLQTV